MADRPPPDRDDHRRPGESGGRRGPGPGQGGRSRPPSRSHRPGQPGGPGHRAGGKPPQGQRRGFGWRSDGDADRTRTDRDDLRREGPRPRPHDRPESRDRPPRPDHRDRPPRPDYRGPRDPGVPPGPRRPWVDRRPWERDRPYPSRPPRPRFEPAAPPIAPLGEDEELVAGRRPVEEAFVAGREARRLLVTPQRRHALEQLVLHATRLRIPIEEVEGGSLTALAGFDGHQGIALVVAARRFASVDEILARAIERGEPPFVLVLDSLEDPQNVGTLLRSAEAAGVHGVIFPTRRQAPLTPSAVKASAGAVEHLLLAPVDDLPGALADMRARGLRIAGAEEDAPLTARQTDLRGPLAIVVGSEGQGLGPAVRRRADTFMRIPMRGVIGSLNAAVAGSILLFEAVAQRDPDGQSTPPRSRGDDRFATPVAREQDVSESVRDAASVQPDTDAEQTPEQTDDEEELLPGGPVVEPPR